MAISDQRLYKLLEDNEYLTKEQLRSAELAAKQERISLYQSVLEQDFVTDKDLGQVVADYYKLPFIALGQIVIPDEVLQIVPEEMARKKKIIAFASSSGVLSVATPNVESKDPLDFLSKKIQGKIKLYYATERDVDDTIRLYKKGLQAAFDALIRHHREHQIPEAQNTPISEVFDMVSSYAYYQKASDIHVEPRKDYSLVRFRIDGILHKVLALPKVLHDQIVSRVKVLSDLRTDEHLSAQDGKMQLHMDEEELDVRVSVVPVVQGEKIVLRLLSSKSRQFSLSDLGISEDGLGKVQKAYKRPFGMVLVTGPTGSGKTTTIYSVLKILNTPEKNIATIEDPVEYEIEGVNQIHVNTQTNLTFAHGLRSILRQDPNIIFVGEIRDQETADIAINSAMTGHLVVSTLHTNDAATAIPRLLDMGIEPFLLASTVNVVIAQRLVRKICGSCRVSSIIKSEALGKNFGAFLTEKYFPKRKEIRIYKGKGCVVCHGTGYSGRVGIFEILEVSEGIKELINQKADSELLTKKAVGEGMASMLEDGLLKVRDAVTTIDEVVRATNE